ncbi:MAG: type II secretion system protein GspH, partial [Alphaproteobacteria bacterium]|nr:type II secretion system protein GspH [Alphaproteobacteria bacterium]
MHRAGTKAGFTLLEMLVVLVLIGVLTGVAVLSLPGDPQRQARQEAERLQQAMQMAADTAVFEGNELGAYFTQQGYGFLRYDYRARQWRAFSD